MRSQSSSSNVSKQLIPGVNLIAITSEDNGEISCTVDETNRIRALLGLKPLNIEKTGKSQSDEAIAVENFRRKQQSEKYEIDQAEIRLKLEKAKNKRLDNQKLQGSDLGTDEGAVSAADWVRRSRIKELTDKEKAKLEAEKAAVRLQEEEDEQLRNQSAYSAADLRGISVKHAANDFESGQQIILTLADADILSKDERGRTIGLNDEDDVLENVSMADEERRLQAEKRGKRAKQAVYTGTYLFLYYLFA